MKHIKKFDESANQPGYQTQQPAYQTQQPAYQSAVPEYEEEVDELEGKIGAGLSEEEYKKIAIKRTQAFFYTKQLNDDFKEIMHLVNWIVEDFQMDPRHDEYCGYINIGVDMFSGGKSGDKLADGLKAMAKHEKLSLEILESVGLEADGIDVGETVVMYKGL